MQDQVSKLKSLNLKSVYLGSAQCDKKVESKSLDPKSEDNIIFVTPEWIMKAENQAKVKILEKDKRLALIAIDEAGEWILWPISFGFAKTIKSNAAVQI